MGRNSSQGNIASPPEIPPAGALHAGLPPGPRSLFPIRIFRDLRRDPLDFLIRLTREYGDISSFKVVGQRYVVLNHPELAREVLLTKAGDFWKGPALQNSKGILGDGLLTAEGQTHKRARRMMQPAFHAQAVERYTAEILRSTAELLERWKNRPGAQTKPIDVRPEMMGLTLVIAGRALFGTLLADDIQTVHRCMDDLMNNYVRTVLPWGWILNLLPLASTRKLARARADLFALVDRIIRERRAEMGNERANRRTGESAKRKDDDLLSLMLTATDAEDSTGCTRMSNAQLRDQAITILTAGHETTANAMTFTLYLLAKHPAEQEKLREEVQRVLGHFAAENLTPGIIDQLPRTRWVLSESMRLYPPAWTIGRENQQPIELGGYRLPKKCTILIPQWTLHRDPRFWDRPLEFLPERWREPAHPRHAYLPFSTGPRNCIGESFAWLEMMLALPLLLREFRYTLPPGAPEMKLTPAITLRPRNPVPLGLRPL